VATEVVMAKTEASEVAMARTEAIEEAIEVVVIIKEMKKATLKTPDTVVAIATTEVLETLMELIRDQDVKVKKEVVITTSVVTQNEAALCNLI